MAPDYFLHKCLQKTVTADAVAIVAHNDNNNIYIKINIKIGPSIININNGNQPCYYYESQNIIIILIIIIHSCNSNDVNVSLQK